MQMRGGEMIKYRLQPNEGQIMKCDQLLLTTRNLVWENNKVFSTERIVCPLHEIKVLNGSMQAFISGDEKFRKLEVHFANGEQKEFNVVGNIEKDKDQKLEIIKWLKAMSIAATGTEGDYEGLEENAHSTKGDDASGVVEVAGAGMAIGKGIASAAFGGGIIGDIVGGTVGGAVGGIVGGTVGLFKNASKNNPTKAPQPPATNEKVSTKCSCCGSPISGRKGQLIHCQYCDSNQQL
jgi:hypothetical protein